MGKLHEYNQTLEEYQSDEYSIRIPIKMIQLTEKDGHVWPLAFDLEDHDGYVTRVEIDRVDSITQSAERKNGAVGDRYECKIKGRTEYLYYTKLQPRKWFLIQKVSEEEYNAYYRLPGESKGNPEA
jgi:hypothetical protein